MRAKPGEARAFLDAAASSQTDDCIIWPFAKQVNGYGTANLNGKITRAHRAVYVLTTGVVPPSSMDVCHSCDNPSCINPRHLFLGTHTENVQDCIRKGRFKYGPVLCGPDSPHSKLNVEKVIHIRSSGLSPIELARIHGVNDATIHHVLKRRTWKYVA